MKPLIMRRYYSTLIFREFLVSIFHSCDTFYEFKTTTS